MAMNQITKMDRKDKMKMRKKIRDELNILLSREKLTPDVIFGRWQERSDKLLKVINPGLKDELFKLLKKNWRRQNCESVLLACENRHGTIDGLEMHDFPFADGII